MKFVHALIDYENGCEQCWEALAEDCIAAGLEDPRGKADDVVVVPPDWIGRKCRHGAPAYAPSILLREVGLEELEEE